MDYCWTFTRVCCRKLICSRALKTIGFLIAVIAACYGLGILSSVILGVWTESRDQDICSRHNSAGIIIVMCFTQGVFFGCILAILGLFLLGFGMAFILILRQCRTCLQQTEEEVNQQLMLRGDVNADILNV